MSFVNVEDLFFCARCRLIHCSNSQTDAIREHEAKISFFKKNFQLVQTHPKILEECVFAPTLISDSDLKNRFELIECFVKLSKCEEAEENLPLNVVRDKFWKLNYENIKILKDCSVLLPKIKDLDDYLSLAELRRSYLKLTEPYKLVNCEVKLNRIKMFWTVEEVSKLESGCSENLNES